MLEEFLAEWTLNWLPIAAIVVGISALIVGISWMIGRLLSNSGITKWAQNEFYQVFGSAVILGIITFVLINTNTILLVILSEEGFQCKEGSCTYNDIRLKPGSTPGILFDDPNNKIQTIQKSCGNPGEESCHIAIAKSKLNSMYDLVRYYMASAIIKGGLIRLMRDLTIIPGKYLGSKLIGWTIELRPLAGADHLLSAYGNMLEINFNLLLLLQVNIFLLTAIEVVIFPMLLITGIILRTFWFSRLLGGLLIAIALTLYFIYPMLIILEALIIMPDPNSFPIGFENFKEQASGSIETTLTNIWSVNVGGEKIDIFTYSIFGPVMKGGVTDMTASFSVWIILQQIIAIYGIVISIREISPFFGGDIEIAGLAKLL